MGRKTESSLEKEKDELALDEKLAKWGVNRHLSARGQGLVAGYEDAAQREAAQREKSAGGGTAQRETAYRQSSTTEIPRLVRE